MTFGYHSGWRISEILGLTWDKVDLREGIVRLDPGETKNEEGRTLYLNEAWVKSEKGKGTTTTSPFTNFATLRPPPASANPFSTPIHLR